MEGSALVKVPAVDAGAVPDDDRGLTPGSRSRGRYIACNQIVGKDQENLRPMEGSR